MKPISIGVEVGRKPRDAPVQRLAALFLCIMLTFDSYACEPESTNRVALFRIIFVQYALVKSRSQ